MKINKLALLFLLTLSLTNCASPNQTLPLDATAQTAFPSAAPSHLPDLVAAPVPTSEPTLTAPSGAFALAQISFVANIETAGIYVSGDNLPETADLLYRSSAEADWRRGHPMTQIDDGRLVGSLFGLSASTKYFVKVTSGASEISGVVTTQPDELTFAPQTIIHVDDDASPGGDGSAAAPYQTIQEGVNHAVPGAQVLVADGIYREAVTFPASGTAGKWIQVKASGNGAILDGSESLAGKKWSTLSGVKKVWFLKLNRPIAYLARDGKRFYNYDTLAGIKKSLGHGKVPMTEGWFYEASTGKLYVRSLDNPTNHSWQAPKLNHAFNVTGRDWVWIEGFEIRYYGVKTDGCGVCALNASHLVIRKNIIHNLQLGVYVNWTGTDAQGNDTRIELNEIYDPPVNEWPWGAVKGSTMEGTGIVLRGHIGAILRGNHIHNFFNGIYTGSSAASAIENPNVAFDADIYENNIHHISDDGLEPEGTCVNHRFRDNKVDVMLVGVSIAPVTQGPAWVLRNLFTNFSSTSIKWSEHSDGIVLIYHNTSWTNAAGVNAMSMIQPVHNTVMRNNIFQGNGYAIEEPFTGSTGHDWNYDNWYTTRGAAGPHFKWENIVYQTLSQFCAATGLECNGHENAPGLVNPSGGDFRLLATSPNIDRGALIYGINNIFNGAGPDIGAYEYVNP
jgi:hypothetical protein